MTLREAIASKKLSLSCMRHFVFCSPAEEQQGTVHFLMDSNTLRLVLTSQSNIKEHVIGRYH